MTGKRRHLKAPRGNNKTEATKQPPPATSRQSQQQRVGVPTGELFSGFTFYLARSLTTDRRAELRELLTQNGGVVANTMDGQCIEIVEREKLYPDRNWVAADFIEDSIRDGMLQELEPYLAPAQNTRAMCEAIWATRQVNFKRRRFTVKDQAKMLRFLKDEYPNYYGKPSVPQSVWKMAAAKKLLPGHTYQSMHGHMKKQLVRLTKKEREVILMRASLDSDESAEESKTHEGDEVDLTERSQVSEATHGSENDATESDGEVDERATKRTKRSHTGIPATHTLTGDEEEEVVHHHQPSEETESTPAAEVPAPEGEQGEAAKRSGEVFRSYWERTAADPVERVKLEKYFEQPVAPVEELEPVTPFNSAASSYRTPQRSRRLSNGSTTPTPQNQRHGRRESTEPSSTPRTPAQAAQDQLLSVLEDMVGQRMTPPRRQSLDRLLPVSHADDTEADVVLARLELETGHDLNTVCSAMYWASGDVKVAKEFLLGYLPLDIWSPAEDRLLVDFMHDHVTEAELAAARRQGKFEGMHGKRSVRDMLRRIQFLL